MLSTGIPPVLVDLFTHVTRFALIHYFESLEHVAYFRPDPSRWTVPLIVLAAL